MQFVVKAARRPSFAPPTAEGGCPHAILIRWADFFASLYAFGGEGTPLWLTRKSVRGPVGFGGAAVRPLEAISTDWLSRLKRLKESAANSSDSFGLCGFCGPSGGRRRRPGSFQDERRSGNLLYAEAWGRAMFRVRWAQCPGAGLLGAGRDCSTSRALSLRRSARFAQEQGLMVTHHDSIV
jgi:hypothetical protein